MEKVFYYHKSKDIFWFRLFGYGLSFQKDSHLVKDMVLKNIFIFWLCY
jgi:hypothetical protein